MANSPELALPLLPEIPPELVVHDQPSRCPYLLDRVARLPLRLPIRKLTRAELDERLEAGDRRQGLLLYRTSCPSCQACEPIRIDIEQFELSRSMRRVLQRGNRCLETSLGVPLADARRVQLYNIHKAGRELSDGQPPIDIDGYREFLVETCCDSFELRYSRGQQLVGVAVTDRGNDSLSAVYCHFDPEHADLSIGTYSILKQVELCRRWKLRWLYLGLYIEASPKMTYKSRFLPHERLLNGSWRRFEAP